jgi:tetratricopeptide (TPR) repeat protein
MLSGLLNRQSFIVIFISLFLVSCAGLLGPDLKTGQKYFAAGDYDAAYQHYRTLINSGATSAKLYRLAYESAFYSGHFKQAGSYYREALANGFDRDSLKHLAGGLWYQRALDVMGRGDWKAASYAAQQVSRYAADSDQDKFCAYILAGKKKYDRGAHKGLWDAVSIYHKAANLNPSSGLPYYLMGKARYKNNRTDYEAALEDYYEALRIEPKGTFVPQAKADIKKIEAVRKKMKAFWGK